MTSGVKEMSTDTPTGWSEVVPRGTSYVTDVRVTSGGAILRLTHPGGTGVVELDCLPQFPDCNPPVGITRVLAIHIRSRREGLESTLIGTSPLGPRRVAISLARALGLACSGVHTVFRTD